MRTRAAVKMSVERSGRRAGLEAAGAALEALGSTPDLALVFATVGYEQRELLSAISEVLGVTCAIAGCSGEGVIARGTSNESDHAVAVMAVKLSGASAESHLIECYGADPIGAAAELAGRIGDAHDVVGVFVFPDGLKGDCTAFLSELRRRLPAVLVAGGAAGDAMTFERTYQYGAGTVGSAAVSAVVLRGQGRLRVAVSHGCTPVGPHQTITRAEGGWLKEIDGQPAWEVFKSYLDGEPADLNAEGIVHLCIGTAADAGARVVADPMIIRTPLALDKQSGALFFPGGGLSTGQPIRMTRRDAEQIRRTAASCAREVLGGERPPAFVLQLDCAGRGKVMFGACAADEIIAPLRAEVGDAVPWAGFHTYGEIAPVSRQLAYHNYTVALCALYDV